MKATEVIPVEEVQEHKTRIQKLKEQMSVIKVSSQDELTAVAGYIGEVKKMKKVVTEARDKYIAPAKEIIARAKADFDPIIDGCDEIESVLKGKAQVFMIAEQKKEDDEKAKILKDGRTNIETKVEKIGEVKQAETKVSSAHGTLGMTKVKEVVIIDEKLIPEEYYKPRELDMVKIKKVATAGVAIPGVEVREKSQMAMRAK